MKKGVLILLMVFGFVTQGFSALINCQGTVLGMLVDGNVTYLNMKLNDGTIVNHNIVNETLVSHYKASAHLALALNAKNLGQQLLIQFNDPNTNSCQTTTQGTVVLPTAIWLTNQAAQ